MSRRTLLRFGRAAAGMFAASARTAEFGTAAASLLQSGSARHAGWRFPSSMIAGAALLLAGGAGAAAASSPKNERSFIMVKPDGVQRNLIAEIIARFERKGYKLVGIKVLVPTQDLAGEHYAEHKERPFFPKLVNFLSSGPVVAMVWEGRGVITYGRSLIGATNPLASAPGTIRGDYAQDVGRNIVHGSDSVDSAQREISLWFSASELASYELRNEADIHE